MLTCCRESLASLPEGTVAIIREDEVEAGRECDTCCESGRGSEGEEVEEEVVETQNISSSSLGLEEVVWARMVDAGREEEVR